MGYNTGTINHASPGNQFRLAMHNEIVAHPTWELYDTVVITTTTYYVYRCRGSVVANPNSWGQDWFLVLSETTLGGTAIGIRAFEGYNPATDLAARPVSSQPSSTALNADTSIGATGGAVLSTGAPVANMAATFDVAPNTIEWYVQVSKNAIKMGYRRSAASSTIYGLYVGLFEPFMVGAYADANEFPLCIATAGSWSGLSQSNLTTSRHPKRPSAAGSTSNHNYTGLAWGPVSGDTGTIDLNFGKALAPRLAIISNLGANIYGRLRGLLYDSRYLPPASGVTLQIGDIITIDGVEHVHFGYNPGNLAVWVPKTAV